MAGEKEQKPVLDIVDLDGKSVMGTPLGEKLLGKFREQEKKEEPKKKPREREEAAGAGAPHETEEGEDSGDDSDDSDDEDERTRTLVHDEDTKEVYYVMHVKV